MDYNGPLGSWGLPVIEDVFVDSTATNPDGERSTVVYGYKRHELSNHLGNVLAAITDRKPL